MLFSWLNADRFYTYSSWLLHREWAVNTTLQLVISIRWGMMLFQIVQWRIWKPMAGEKNAFASSSDDFVVIPKGVITMVWGMMIYVWKQPTEDMKSVTYATCLFILLKRKQRFQIKTVAHPNAKWNSGFTMRSWSRARMSNYIILITWFIR